MNSKNSKLPKLAIKRKYRQRGSFNPDSDAIEAAREQYLKSGGRITKLETPPSRNTNPVNPKDSTRLAKWGFTCL